MKPIKFHELSVKGGSVLWLFLMVGGVVFLVLNLFDVFSFLDPKLVKWITAAVYLGIAAFNMRPFFYRNHVQWNKRGITIRVNSFFGTNFSYADVKRIDYSEDRYTVYKYSGGNPKVIDLAGIDQGSKERLLQILQGYVR